jgi:membrane protease YdiL (CAAX protease family)
MHVDPSERRRTIAGVAGFCALVTAVAWVAPALGGTPASPGPGFVLWATAPLVVALLVRALSRDWADLGLRPGFRRNLRWYGVSALGLPAVMAVALALGGVTGVATVTEFDLGTYLATVAVAVPVFLVFALFEEIGWRGYLAPKLAALEVNPCIAAALVAVVWTAWHIPYLRELTWISADSDLLAFIPRYTLLLFAFSLLQGELRALTATFWPAVLLHGMGNAVGHPLAESVTVASGMEWLGSVSTGLYVVVLAGIAGTALWVVRRRVARGMVRPWAGLA